MGTSSDDDVDGGDAVEEVRLRLGGLLERADEARDDDLELDREVVVEDGDADGVLCMETMYWSGVGEDDVDVVLEIV